MKKILFVMGVAVLCASCGSTPAPTPEPIPEPAPVVEETTPEPTPEPEPAPVVVPEPVRAVYKGAIPAGSWIDFNWNADWGFNGSSIILADSVTGEQYYEFTDDKITNVQVKQTDGGITLSFDCAETHRSYAFTRELHTDTSLVLEIQRDWVKTPYRVVIPYREPKSE